MSSRQEAQAHLQFAYVRRNAHARNPMHDEFGSDNRLRSTNIARPKEELAVEVGEINGVHVNNMDVTKAAEGEPLEQLQQMGWLPGMSPKITVPGLRSLHNRVRLRQEPTPSPR